MSDGIYAALSGAVAQERALEVVANNIANVGTTGFRGDRVTFVESLSRAAGPTEVPVSIRYVEVDRVLVDMASGPVETTGNPLDLAISGGAFFGVATPDGERFTRDGRFLAGTDGVVRSLRGDALLMENGRTPLTIPPGTTSVTVAPDGSVSAGTTVLGRIRLVDVDPATLRHEGNSLFAATGARNADGSNVLAGCLEGANVGAIAGMNELVNATRTFEAFQRVIQGFRDIDNRSARELAST
jgi:flagellar basal body rod protein FlgG